MTELPEFKIKRKMKQRTDWRGHKERRNGRLVGVAKTSEELVEERRLQRKNLKKLGLPKREEWPQCHKVSSWQVRQSHLCQQEKDPSHQSRSPNH